MAISLNSIIMFLLLSILFNGTPAQATQLSCSSTTVTFEYEGDIDLKNACSTISAAQSFLEGIGLKANNHITIKLVHHPLSEHNPYLFGTYNTKSQEIQVITYAKMQELATRSKTIFGIPLSEDLWCSYVAHEFAHSISDQYINHRSNTHTAGEYISAVTQLTILPPAIRAEILSHYKDVSAYKSIAEMSDLYFFIAPNKFAIKCYRHFISLNNPQEVIDQLLKHEDDF